MLHGPPAFGMQFIAEPPFPILSHQYLHCEVHTASSSTRCLKRQAARAVALELHGRGIDGTKALDLAGCSGGHRRVQLLCGRGAQGTGSALCGTPKALFLSLGQQTISNHAPIYSIHLYTVQYIHTTKASMNSYPAPIYLPKFL